jgi:hypothetical protein
MLIKKAVMGLASLLLAAVLVTGCEDSVPTEPQADGTPSLTAAPKKATPVTAVMDVVGPIPGLPNLTNPECLTVDTETGMAHFKKCTVTGSVTGDLVGTMTVLLNGEQNLATLAARKVNGYFTFDGCVPDVGCGAFKGPYKGEVAAGGQASLRGSGHGTGDFHTMQIRLGALERGGTEIFDVDGVIF